jgi:signal transduction histidine kinase
LEEALARIEQEFSAGTGDEKPVKFRVLVEGRQRPLNPLLRDEVYGIGRDGVTNAFRHARATRIEVELKYGSRDFRLIVRDDGCGVGTPSLKTDRDGHPGLRRMRERANRIGARFHVYSGRSTGTEVFLLVPGVVAYGDGQTPIRDRLRKLRRGLAGICAPNFRVSEMTYE